MSRSERNRGNRNSRKRREKGKKFKRDMRSFLKEFDIEQYLERAKSMDRRFILHVGPTNSGKTYDALQALKTAGRGVYLGPLRLLAILLMSRVCPVNFSRERSLFVLRMRR